MSEEKQVTQAETNSETNPSTQASQNNDNVPYSRFSEVVSERNTMKDEMKKLQDQLASIDADRKVAREEKLKKNEEYETLIAEKNTEIEKLTGTANKWTEYEATRREVLTGKLPENRQKFASSMNLSDLEEFVGLENTNQSAGKTNPSRVGVNPTGEFGGYSSYGEWANKDPKGYAKATGTLDGRGIKIAYSGNE